MITPKEADKLAQEALQDYVNKCQCESDQDAANVIMKMTSLCGMAMCALVGHAEAVERMVDTTEYVNQTQAGKTWKRATVQ